LVAYRRWLDITPQVGHWFTDSRREWLYALSFFWFSLVFFTEIIVVLEGDLINSGLGSTKFALVIVLILCFLNLFLWQITYRHQIPSDRLTETLH
jgi:hypothetical protein